MPDLVGGLVFFAAIAATISVGASRPEHWGLRRMFLGVAGVLGASAGALSNGSPWWFAVALWALQQCYAGWGFTARRRRTDHERADYLEASATVLGCVALADGSISVAERHVIQRAYRAAGCSSDELTVIERTLDTCEQQFRNEGSDADRLFHRLRKACDSLSRHSNTIIREEFVRCALVIITSDGYVSATEEELIRAAATWLGLRQDHFESMWRDVRAGRRHSPREQNGEDETTGPSTDQGPVAPSDLATHYASVLGITVTATPSEVRRAYLEKAKQYHPDTVAHRGPVFTAEAETRFKEISRAYAFFRGTVAT